MCTGNRCAVSGWRKCGGHGGGAVAGRDLRRDAACRVSCATKDAAGASFTMCSYVAGAFGLSSQPSSPTATTSARKRSLRLRAPPGLNTRSSSGSRSTSKIAIKSARASRRVWPLLLRRQRKQCWHHPLGAVHDFLQRTPLRPRSSDVAELPVSEEVRPLTCQSFRQTSPINRRAPARITGGIGIPTGASFSPILVSRRHNAPVAVQRQHCSTRRRVSSNRRYDRNRDAAMVPAP